MRRRLQSNLGTLDEARLWAAQARAIKALEASLARGDARALIQMATGSGKTFTAVNLAYRLLKHASAKRILFLVDRNNLGRQTFNEFTHFEPPDEVRKFPALYNVQRLDENAINPASNIVITTIQRLFSMLKGEPDNEDGSAFETLAWRSEPPTVTYNGQIPPGNAAHKRANDGPPHHRRRAVLRLRHNRIGEGSRQSDGLPSLAARPQG